jgi:uncharacterized protein YydD (DUF2326 family)
VIYAVRSDSPSFREVKLTSGFNVILAERSGESSHQDTRNGVGKSTLLEIIHFCLGASADRRSALTSPLVAHWTFILEFSIGPLRFTSYRSPATQKEIRIEGDVENLPISLKKIDELGRAVLSVSSWNSCLGSLMFGLTPESKQRKENGGYRPTFRGLISYFIRRGSGAYLSPFTSHSKQQEWDKQVSDAFLLGLEWEDSRDWQLIRDRKKELDTFQKATATGIAKEFFGSLGELEATKVRHEASVKEQARALDSFQVHPQYQSLEVRANELTELIHELANTNVVEQQLVNSYRKNTQEEQSTGDRDVGKLYEEAGVVLPELVQRRLTEIQAFHAEVVENRKLFLENEILRLSVEVSRRNAMIVDLSNERSELLEILKTHGALEEYTRLQSLHTKLVQELREVEARIDALTRLQREKSEARIRQESLLQRAQTNFIGRRSQRDTAIAAFNANSLELYRAPGNLVIDIGTSGFRFDIEIERSRSHGVENMKIFCFDLTLAQIWSGRDPSPNLLMHDSMIFDGVDERQIALALELAERRAREHGFQYMCTLNSDTVPWGELSEGFDLKSFVRLELTDAHPAGALLGIRY